MSKENPCYFVSGETADPAAEEPEVGEGASWTETQLEWLGGRGPGPGSARVRPGPGAAHGSYAASAYGFERLNLLQILLGCPWWC